MRQTVGVMGPSGKLTPTQENDAFEIGKLIAENGYALITGGLDGIMEAASKGAKVAGGLVIGICPIREKKYVNVYVDISIMTNMGGGRNYMNILSSDIVIAFGSSQSGGTLSEIAFALQSAVPLMVFKPPAKMQDFLTSFQTRGLVRFGTSIADVDFFIGEAFKELQMRSRKE